MMNLFMNKNNFMRFDDLIKAMNKRVDAVLENKERIIFSVYKYKDGVPIDNLDEIPVKGKVIFVAEKDDFFGGKLSEDYQSEIVENPTWLQICVLFSDSVSKTKDFHHVYLEGITEKSNIDGIPCYEFLTGS